MLEQHADYDGLAVVWGIGHTTQTAEDCAEACRSYSPTLQQGGECSLFILTMRAPAPTLFCSGQRCAAQCIFIFCADKLPVAIALACCIILSDVPMLFNAAGPFSRLPCNVFAWCSEQTCFEPDVHTHSFGDCWLKFSEGPLNPEVQSAYGQDCSVLKHSITHKGCIVNIMLPSDCTESLKKSPPLCG